MQTVSCNPDIDSQLNWTSQICQLCSNTMHLLIKYCIVLVFFVTYLLKHQYYKNVLYLSAYGKITLSPSYNKVLLLSLLLSSSLIILLLLRSFSISMGSDLVILMIIVPQRFVEVGLVGSVRQSRIGFWMITCDGKVRLKLGVIHVCICIL